MAPFGVERAFFDLFDADDSNLQPNIQQARENIAADILTKIEDAVKVPVRYAAFGPRRSDRRKVSSWTSPN